MLNVWSFARHIMAAGNLLSEVRVAGDTVAAAIGRRIRHIIVAQTCVLIEFQNPDATAP